MLTFTVIAVALKSCSDLCPMFNNWVVIVVVRNGLVCVGSIRREVWQKFINEAVQQRQHVSCAPRCCLSGLLLAFYQVYLRSPRIETVETVVGSCYHPVILGICVPCELALYKCP